MQSFEFITFIVFFVFYSLGTVSYLVYGLTRYAFWGILGFGLFSLGLLFMSANILFRAIVSGRAPFSNLYESLLIFAWGIVLFLLIYQIRTRLHLLGTIISPLVISLLLVTLYTERSIRELMPALQSPWMIYHVGTAIIAYSAFTISFGFAVLYLIRNYLDKRAPGSPLLGHIPGTEALDRMIYDSIALGVPMLALLIVTGAIWADFAWGSYWRWDPKEVWSLITFLIYGVYLHGKYLSRWKGQSAAIIAIVGFVSVIICYLGVNLFFAGIHSYGAK